MSTNISTNNKKLSPSHAKKKPPFMRFVGNSTTYKYYENIMLRNVTSNNNSSNHKIK